MNNIFDIEYEELTKETLFDKHNIKHEFTAIKTRFAWWEDIIHKFVKYNKHNNNIILPLDYDICAAGDLWENSTINIKHNIINLINHFCNNNKISLIYTFRTHAALFIIHKNKLSLSRRKYNNTLKKLKKYNINKIIFLKYT